MSDEGLYDREESPKVWLYIIISITVLVLLVNIHELRYGSTDIAAFLLFCPVVIAAYWYPNKSLAFALDYFRDVSWHCIPVYFRIIE